MGKKNAMGWILSFWSTMNTEQHKMYYDFKCKISLKTVIYNGVI